MGLSTTKHVAVDHQDQDWGQALLQSGMGDPPKPPPIRQQPLLKCPRCSSTNTKFCYFNNYNKTQPRHFCRSCKRHWTIGGALRNVPVGGGRKNKRHKISNTSSPRLQNCTNIVEQNPNKEFTLSSLNTFEMNSSLIINPTSYQSLNAYDQYYPIPSSFESPDKRVTGVEDFTNYWNSIWKNETSSDINIVWDNDEILYLEN